MSIPPNAMYGRMQRNNRMDISFGIVITRHFFYSIKKNLLVLLEVSLMVDELL